MTVTFWFCLIASAFLVIGVIVILWRLTREDHNGTMHGWGLVGVGLGIGWLAILMGR